MADTVGTEAGAAEHDAYSVGGGIASPAGAAFLLRGTEIPGENAHVLERRQAFGGVLDRHGTPRKGYVLPGGRMFNFPTYECTWSLFRSIPSLEDSDITIRGKMGEFSEEHEMHAEARLVGAGREILGAFPYGFETQHRLSLLRPLLTPRGRPGKTRIKEWFDETFSGITFRYLRATTLALQPWCSAAEIHRYMQRFTREFPQLHTLSGVPRTKYNQHDSVVRPLRR